MFSNHKLFFKHVRLFQINILYNSTSKDIAKNVVTCNASASSTEEAGQCKPQQLASNIVQSFPEEPTTCCMSGCPTCVWLDYAEKLSEYYKDGGEQALRHIQEKITDENIKAFIMHEARMRLKTGPK